MKTQKMNANKAISMGILVVNDGLACQNKVLEVLRHCDYEVLHTGTVYDALHSIWENKDKVDLVITDVHKLESDGVTIIQNIKERLKLQVMLIDIDEKAELKGEPLSFSAYFLTGLSLTGLSHLLVNAKQVKEDKVVAATNLQENVQIASVSNVVVAEANKDSFSIEDAAFLRQKQKAVELYEEISEDGHNDHYKGKKRRVTWTNEMHQKFLDAIERLGYDKAVPKRIVEVMGVPGLTRENVASHLQKYRWSMKRTKETVFGSYLTGEDLVFGSTMGTEFYTRIRSDVRNMMQWRDKHCLSSDNNTSKFVGYRFKGNQIDYGPINKINTVAEFSTTGRLQDQSMSHVQHHPLSDQNASCIMQQSSLLGSSASRNHCQEPLEIESLLQGPPTQQPQQISGDCSGSLLDQLESWGSSANAVHFHDPTTASSVLHPPSQDFFEQTPSGFFDDIFQQHCSPATTPPLDEMFRNLDDVFDRNTYDLIDIQEFDDTHFSQDDYTYSNVAC